MANKSPNDAALQSTKQMLDELDALMEKMLTLPVNDLDDPAVVPPMVVPEPTLAATLTLLEPARVAPPAPPSKKPVSRPSYQVPELDAPKADDAPVAPSPYNPPHFELPAEESRDEPAPLTNEVMTTSVLPRLEPLMTEIAEPATSLQTQWLYLPLVWMNQGFDRTTLVLGGAGGWMRSQGGRMLLGFSGVAMMIAAVGWFLKDWLGWNW